MLDLNNLQNAHGPIMLVLKDGQTIGPVLFQSVQLGNNLISDYTFRELATNRELRFNQLLIQSARLV